MNKPADDLVERAKARAAQFAAERLDPWALEMVRRDTEVAHRWLEKQKERI